MVVLIGEIGGIYEEQAADTVSRMNMPLIAMMGGIRVPVGKRMGHAGAIIEGHMGTARSKLEILERAGAHAASTFLNIPRLLRLRGIAPSAIEERGG